MEGGAGKGAGQQFWALTRGGGMWSSRQEALCAGGCVWFLSASEGLEWMSLEPKALSRIWVQTWEGRGRARVLKDTQHQGQGW